MFVIRRDIFLIVLILDVSKWYDKWYNGNIGTIKSFHIQTLLHYYDPKRFEECDNLYEERIKFLIEVQEIVNTQQSVPGGYEIWTI